MVTSIPLSKFLKWKLFWSLFPSPVDWLKCNMVGWIVGSVQFALSYLNGFTIPIDYFTAPPISVVGNNIWTGCFVPVIEFLFILFSSGMDAICLDSSSRLSRKVSKKVMNYFAFPTLIFLIFGSIFSLFFSIVLLASIVSLSFILIFVSFFT